MWVLLAPHIHLITKIWYRYSFWYW
jgi:hypothetical protein